MCCGTRPGTIRSSSSGKWIRRGSSGWRPIRCSGWSWTGSWPGWPASRATSTPGSGGRGPISGQQTAAYFCAEFALHNSVPIYSGGLGVLAGDHCKAASDLGVPLVGIGLFYQKGYFDQRIRLDGWQEDIDEELDPPLLPVTPMIGLGGKPWVAIVNTFGRAVHVRAWRIRVGRVPIYLLDTNLEENHPDDRSLLNKLYGGGEDLRLRQEWILGTGGVRVLRALGIDPVVWHANEGHAAFMLLERVRELVAQGARRSTRPWRRFAQHPYSRPTPRSRRATTRSTKRRSPSAWARSGRTSACHASDSWGSRSIRCMAPADSI